MKKQLNVKMLVLMGMMAAIIYVVTLFRFPLLGSKVHFANAMCLLSGLLLGDVCGGLAAGLGSALYDAFGGGYDLVQVLITFASKFMMAWVCARIVWRGEKREERFWVVVLGCVAGALTYVALYMLKTYVYQAFVYNFPAKTVWATLLSKLVPSLINAGAAIVATPLFYKALMPALKPILKD